VNRNSSVSKVMGFGLGDLGFIPGRDREFCLNHHMQTSLLPSGYGDSFLGDKVTLPPCAFMVGCIGTWEASSFHFVYLHFKIYDVMAHFLILYHSSFLNCFIHLLYG
jgi:hypothetical protein